MLHAKKVAAPEAAAGSRSWTVLIGVVLCALAVLALALAVPSGAGQAAGPLPAQAPALTVSKEAAPARVVSGGLITYTVVFSNGSDQVGTLEAITDTLDASLSFEGMLPGSDVLTPPLPAGDGLVWQGPIDVPAGGTLTLLYQARTAASTAWTYPCNSIQATAGGFQLGPVQACVLVGPERALSFLPLTSQGFNFAELTLAKTAAPAVVGPGQLVTYTVTVRNIGDEPGSLATVVDLLPAGFGFDSMAPGSDVIANPVVAGGTLTWSPARILGPGTSLQLIYRATASQVPGKYANQVTITSGDAHVPSAPAAATVTVALALEDHFESGIGLWTPFLNYWRLEEGQWYWGPTDGVGGSGAATHSCCIGDKEAADALLMYLGDGAEEWTDYRVEAQMLLRGGVDADGNWSYIDGDPIGLWVRGQYDYVEGVTIRAQWVTGYYVVIAGKPDRDNMVVRLTQIQTLDDCLAEACENPQNLYTFNNIYVLAETPLYKPYLRDVWYKLTVEVRGPRITVWLNDQQVIDFEDTKVPFLTGTVGFKTHETWTASFDDLIVTPLP